MNKRQRKKALKKMRSNPLGEIQFQINDLMNKIIKAEKTGIAPRDLLVPRSAKGVSS